MKKSYIRHFCKINLGVFILVLSAGCDFTGQNPQGSEKKKENYTKEELLRINETRKQAEERRINKYVERSGLEFKRTNTGLRYFIYEKGSGDQPRTTEGQIAAIDFSVSILNGDTVYRSVPGRPAEFLIGKDHVESGLHEGVTYLQPGDKAKLILPPHLAHGLAGDLKKIPMHATIIYDLHLVEVR